MDSLIVAILSPSVFIALIGLLLKIVPGLFRWIANILYAQIDPSQLPYGTKMNEHFQTVRENTEALERLEKAQIESRRDTTKNTLIMLMSLPGDHRTEVRYELSKLELLGYKGWVLDMARAYIIDGANPLSHTDDDGGH